MMKSHSCFEIEMCSYSCFWICKTIHWLLVGFLDKSLYSPWKLQWCELPEHRMKSTRMADRPPLNMKIFPGARAIT
ncbi:hypothetical protein KC19_VG039200 [Ceratodon purpureus]|uniref:Uncharacterized protein n=1 Tax=Ceratodon purpureus TaxID=3225 RepID=A0A8T0HLQ6_CERPU|nr:hypothetical protein KC19_VG039200 [Ceratodon purpureus]